MARYGTRVARNIAGTARTIQTTCLLKNSPAWASSSPRAIPVRPRNIRANVQATIDQGSRRSQAALSMGVGLYATQTNFPKMGLFRGIRQAQTCRLIRRRRLFHLLAVWGPVTFHGRPLRDRKSTRLNSSHP